MSSCGSLRGLILPGHPRTATPSRPDAVRSSDGGPRPPSEKTGEPITVADRVRRVIPLAGFLPDIAEWGWPDAPGRKIVFRDDIPNAPQVLPRYLPVDVDRRLTTALTEQPTNQLAAAGQRLQRACGLRIGELLDLEPDCVHQVPEHGHWLKVPLGKLDTERMVPIDEESSGWSTTSSSCAPRAGRCRIRVTGAPPSSCSPTWAAA